MRVSIVFGSLRADPRFAKYVKSGVIAKISKMYRVPEDRIYRYILHCLADASIPTECTKACITSVMTELCDNAFSDWRYLIRLAIAKSTLVHSL